MPRGAFPGFLWDAAAQMYRRLLSSGEVGGFVPRQDIIAVLDMLAERSAHILGDLALGVAEGNMVANDATLAGCMLLKDWYNAAAALARGGWQQMDAAAWGRNGYILGVGGKEYQRWRDFITEAAAGKLTEAQIRARASLYVGKAYSRFWYEDRLLKLQDSAYTWEQWLDNDDPPRECADCLALAALGKVPVGTLRTVPGAGATACLGACRCAIEYGTA